MKRHNSVAWLSAGLLAVVTGGVQAGPLTFNISGSGGSSISVTAPGIGTQSVTGGDYLITPNGTGWPSYVPGSFYSYCVDLVDVFTPGLQSNYSIKPFTTAADYLESSPPNAPVSSIALTRVGQLIAYAQTTWSAADIGAFTTGQTNAVQAGIWEIIYEPSPNNSFNLTSGNFRVGTLTTEMATLQTGVTSGSVDAVTSYQRYAVLFNETQAAAGGGIGLYQDFLVPVPEPEAYGLALAGMGVLTVVMRRRQAGKSA